MALVITSKLVESAGHYNSATSFTSAGSFTPADNSLLIAIVNTINDSTPDTVAAVSLSGGSLTWTKQTSISAFTSSSGGYFAGLIVYTAPVTTGASMSLTASGYVTGGDSYYGFEVIQATGYNTSTPLGATALSNNVNVTNPSLTLSGAPSSTSEVVSAFCVNPNNTPSTPTPGGSYSLLQNSGTGSTVVEGTEHLSGTTSTAVNWSNIGCAIYSSNCVVNAFEILAAGGGASAYVAGQSALSFMGMA